MWPADHGNLERCVACTQPISSAHRATPRPWPVDVHAGCKQLPLAWLGPLRSLRSLDLSGTDNVTADDAAALAGMTALTALAMRVTRTPRPADETAQQQLYEAIGSLRHLARLNLYCGTLTAAALAALAPSPVTKLEARDLLVGPELAPLPPRLVELVLDVSPSVVELACLGPAPASLELIEASKAMDIKDGAYSHHVCLVSPSWRPGPGPRDTVEELLDTITGLMPAAVALLAGRLKFKPEEDCPHLMLTAWGDQPSLRALAGGRLGHAAWLRHLAPLQCRDLLLDSLALVAGDLAALAAALPHLEVRWAPGGDANQACGRAGGHWLPIAVHGFRNALHLRDTVLLVPPADADRICTRMTRSLSSPAPPPRPPHARRPCGWSCARFRRRLCLTWRPYLASSAFPSGSVTSRSAAPVAWPC